jgi:hypothetical protein
MLFAAAAGMNRLAQIARVGRINTKDSMLDVFQGVKAMLVRQHIALRDESTQLVEKLRGLHFAHVSNQKLAVNRRTGKTYRFDERDLAAAQVNLALHCLIFDTKRPGVEPLI